MLGGVDRSENRISFAKRFLLVNGAWIAAVLIVMFLPLPRRPAMSFQLLGEVLVWLPIGCCRLFVGSNLHAVLAFPVGFIVHMVMVVATLCTSRASVFRPVFVGLLLLLTLDVVGLFAVFSLG